MGAVDEDQLRRIQIRETILTHIERERELFNKGIKVLMLSPGSMRTPMDRSDIRKKGISMPFLDMKEVADGALDAAERGKASFVPTFYYRMYTLWCKLFPSSYTARKIGKNYQE